MLLGGAEQKLRPKRRFSSRSICRRVWIISSHVETCPVVTEGDYEGVLALYENKGLVAAAASILGFKDRKGLEEFIGRALNSEAGDALREALQKILPSVKAHRGEPNKPTEEELADVEDKAATA